MSMLKTLDVSKSVDFQKDFTSFYKIRFPKKEYYDIYYQFMQKNKLNSSLTFSEVLRYFHKMFNRIDASFSSKLLHTIQPDKPTWDHWIGRNTGIIIPPFNSKDRLNTAIIRYEKLIAYFNDYKSSEEGKILIQMFDLKFPNSGITNTKKIDLVLWQIRDN
jgi:hypothetical protein